MPTAKDLGPVPFIQFTTYFSKFIINTTLDITNVVELQMMLHLDVIDSLILALKARVARLFK